MSRVLSICILFLSLGLFNSSIVNAQVIYTPKDSIVFREVITALKEKNKEPIGDIVVASALYFQGSPYVANTLDVMSQEQLIVNLRQFDCTTFVETCIALARVTKSDDHSFSNFIANLTAIRYREGQIDGYNSRLHYVSDWKYEGERDSIFTDITKEIGGGLINKPINFMSTHPQSYAILINNDTEVQKMSTIENAINKRNSYYVIPRNDITSVEAKIENGDIIAFATSIAGLDYSHIGIAYRKQNGELGFIHASSAAKKVIIQNGTLAQYCQSVKSNRGISVFRLNEIN